MTVKNLIKKLSKFDENLIVLGEFDSDGDDFFVKVDLKKVYKGNNIDDANWEDYGKKYCIIRLDY